VDIAPTAQHRPRLHDLRHNAEFRIIPSSGWFSAGLRG